MVRKYVTGLLLVVLIASSASPVMAQQGYDAKAIVAAAMKAGGYEGLNTIEYIGSGVGEGGVGQQQSPEVGWDKRTLKNYSRFIDYAAGTSQRNALLSRPLDKTGQLSGGGGLPPANAVAEAPSTANIAANGTWAQKFEISLSPPGFLRLASAASSPAVFLRIVGKKRQMAISFPVEQKAPSGVNYRITGYINDQNLVDSVETAVEEALIGDMVVEQIYSDYKDFNGVKFPTKIVQKRGGLIHADFAITDVKKNSPAPAPVAAGGGGRGAPGAAPAPRGGPGGAAPAAPGAPAPGGRGAPGAAPGGGQRGGPGAPGGAPGAAVPPVPGGGAPAAAAGPAAGGQRGGAAPAAPGGGQRGGGNAVGSRKLGEGIYLITGGYQSVAVEFSNFVVMMDAQQNAASTAAIIAEIKRLFPKKPIRYAILTHAHFDHIGGLRTAFLEGATAVTHKMNKEMLEEWISKPRTLPAGSPDELEKSGKKPKFEYMTDKKVISDSMNTIELYHLEGVMHSEDMIVAYFPKIKAVFESDAFNPPAATAATPTGDQISGFEKLFASELDRLKIDYTLILSGHQPGGGDRDVTKADLLKRVGRAN